MRTNKRSMPKPIEPLSRDDAELMSQIYQKYYGNMKKAVLTLISGPDVEDIIQDTVVRMIQAINNWRDLCENQMYSYTYNAARNNSINHLRTQKKKLYPILEAEGENEWDNSLDARLIKKENIEELYRILDQLNVRDRDLLRMKYKDRLPDWEIAALLGIKKESVSGLVSRARKRVLKIAKKEGLLRDGGYEPFGS